MSATATPSDVLNGSARWALVEGSNSDPATGLASLPDKSIAHTIMDPPYEAEAHSKGRRVVTSRNGKGSGPGGDTIAIRPISYDPITQDERESVADQVQRVTRGWSLTFCQSEAAHKWAGAYVSGGARYIRTGVYWKLDAQPQYSGDRPGVGWEAVVICWHGKVRPSWNGGGKCARWMVARDGRAGSIHGSALVDGCKPLALMDQLVADFTDDDDVILDPYSGSATTLLAALRGNRRAIGWEKKAEHYRISHARLNGDEVRPVPGQLGLAIGATR